jgi:cyclic dehypoxanthinyl futalosine synthase
MAWTEREALDAIRATDLLAIGMDADQLRSALHPEGVVTYSLVAPAGLVFEAAVQQALTQGSGAVTLSGVADIAGLTLHQLEARMLAVHRASPSVTFHSLRAVHLRSDDMAAALERLHGAGLRSILFELPAEDASLFAPAPAELLLRAAARLSIGVTVAYTIGRGESTEERVTELRSIRLLQQSTHAMQSIALRIHHAATPEARREEEATAVDFLKTLAAARLFLDTIDHVTAEWDAMGPKVLELALRFGADDAGAVPWSQDARGGPSHHGGEAELRRIIRDAGFRPVERDALFRQSLLR